MTITRCDRCEKDIQRLSVVVSPVKTASHGQSPDGYRFLSFVDHSCAQGEWRYRDLCYSCCAEEFKSSVVKGPTQ